MADARDLKSRGSNPVPVRPRSPAPYRGVEQLVARRAHNPEVGGSSPPPATIKSLEIKRFQGFFLFSNWKVSDQASGILCTKFGRFGGQNLVQSRWGMCRSSPLPCPIVDLKPPAAFCTENRVRQAVSFSFCLTHTGFESTCPIILANPWRKIYFFRNYRILLHLHRPSNDTRFVRYPRLPV